MVDTALVGTGPAPLAALAVSVVVFNLAFTLFNFLAVRRHRTRRPPYELGHAHEVPGLPYRRRVAVVPRRRRHYRRRGSCRAIGAPG